MRLLRRPALALASAAMLVVAVAVITNALPLRQIVDQRQEVAATRAKLAQLTSENDVLTDQVAALQTPLEVERLAREKLGYVRPGEAAYVVIEQPTGQPSFDETTVVPDQGDSVSMVTRIWNFMTGRDLVGG